MTAAHVSVPCPFCDLSEDGRATLTVQHKNDFFINADILEQPLSGDTVPNLPEPYTKYSVLPN